MRKNKKSFSIILGIFLGLAFLLGLFLLGRNQQLNFLNLNERAVKLIGISKPDSDEIPAKLTPEPTITEPSAVEETATPQPSPETDSSPEPVQTSAPVESITYNVPFTAQAPLGNWEDPYQQDGCEEASALMAVRWAKAEPIPGPETARDIIVAAGEWQKQNYPTAIDTSAEDTADRIIRNYFEWPHVTVKEINSLDPILRTLQEGSLVITPMNGQALGNPNYTGEGPERHMLVVIGYDAQAGEVITNDPGTRQGSGYRYSEDIFWNAIRDYPTGDKVPITSVNKMMIVVSKP